MSTKPVRFSLVVATVGRERELERLLASLAEQTFKNFEVLVVDQNRDDRLIRVVEQFKRSISIKRLTSIPGLSRARNIALPFVSGDIVGFPDDDCWYPASTLEKVNDFFLQSPSLDGVTGRYSNEAGATEGRWPKQPGFVDRKNVWRTAISFTIFLRHGVIKSTGSFDEQLGVGSGSRWGSGEETDYLLRGLAKGAKIWFEPELILKHPVKVTSANRVESLKRVRSYAAGAGRVVAKHRYSIGYKSIFLMKSGFKIFFNLALFRANSAHIALAEFRGRVAGLVGRER